MAFTWTPDYKAEKRQKPNVQGVRFGDGYEQRATFGINTNPQTWALRFSNREMAEADEIDEFLAENNGVDAFEWTPPDADDSINVICREWSRVKEHPGRDTITATFEEVFDPG